MKREENYCHKNPVYTSVSEVFKAAHQNVDYFDTFGKSLKNSFKFYESNSNC